jgi:O-antigen ligase
VDIDSAVKTAQETSNKSEWSGRLLFGSLWCLFFFISFATSPAVIAGGLAIGIWLLSGKCFQNRHQWLNQSWTAPVFFFMLLPWLGLLWTNDMTAGLKIATKSYYWLYAFILASSGFPQKTARKLLKAFIAGLGFICVLSLLQFTGILTHTKALPSILTEAPGIATASLMLVFGIMVVSFFFSKAAGFKLKVFWASLMLLFFVTLALSHGRAGHLAFVLLLPLLLYTLTGRKAVILLVPISLALAGALLFSPVVQNRISMAMNDIKEYQQTNPNTSVGLRLHMWKGALRIIGENPVLGVGTGGYALAMKKYEPPQLLPEFHVLSHPHNSFLYMAVSFGIPGTLSLIWLLYVFLDYGWRNRAILAGFSVFSFGLILIIGSMTDTQILCLGTAKMFALLMGMRGEQS